MKYQYISIFGYNLGVQSGVFRLTRFLNGMRREQLNGTEENRRVKRGVRSTVVSGRKVLLYCILEILRLSHFVTRMLGDCG